MGFIALNPSTGTLLTIAASPESGDPYTFITGNSNSKKGNRRVLLIFGTWPMLPASIGRLMIFHMRIKILHAIRGRSLKVDGVPILGK